MRRQIAKYRWELWLVVGIPVLKGACTIILYPVSDVLLDSDLVVSVGLNLIGLALYAGSYPRVRRLGRRFLTVLWGYFIAASAISVIVAGILLPIRAATESLSAEFGSMLVVHAYALPFFVLALLWFARQASRLSFVHALFLVVFVSFPTLGFSSGPSGVDVGFYFFALLGGGAIALALMLVKVWLLGNFDLRSPEFRRGAVAALVVAITLAGYGRIALDALAGSGEEPNSFAFLLFAYFEGAVALVAALVFNAAWLLATLVLVHLVRVRQPEVGPRVQ